MRRQTRDSIPAPLARLKQRFMTWRKTRRRGERIPAPLWQAAAQIAADFGLCQTATVLRLDYYSLKRRMDSQPECNLPAATFLELPPVVGAPASECVIELQDGLGASMRMHLRGPQIPDIVALSREFWGAE
jgi:hypothetical protein